MNILILTEGGKEQGFGHIIRCSSIYNAFIQLNQAVKFVVNGDSSVENILSSFNYELLDWINNPLDLNSIDIILIDSYIADKSFYDKISKEIPILIILDDNIRLEYPKSIVVNGTILAESLNYPTNDKIDYLLGSEYIPLRSDFFNCSKVEINEEIKTILITMGGADIRHLTPQILEVLPSNYNKVVIVGKGFSNIERIPKDKNTQLIFNPNAQGMLKAMLKSDIAISASGQTLYELACLGLPTIAIGVIDNQKYNIENWQKVGFIEYAGFWNNPTLKTNILDKINLLQSQKLRKEKHLKGVNAVDGKGALKIAKYVLNKFYKENSILRSIKSSDCLKIYKLANDDIVRESSFNNEKISLDVHKVWFNQILKDNQIKFFVLEYNDDLIGQLRFDFSEDNPVVSLSLNKKYRGLGLANYLLEESIKKIQVDKIIAYIKKDNLKSIELFENSDFKFDEEVKIKNNQALKFIRSIADEN